MKYFLIFASLSVVCFSFSFAAKPKAPNVAYLKAVEECAKSNSDLPPLRIIKQWHLGAGVNTKEVKNVYPQEKNQLEIYDQVSVWIENGEVDTAIAEGCEGKEIDSKFDTSFQGWTMKDLTAILDKKNQFRNALAHPVIKLEAKFNSRLRSVCADSESETKKAQLALSDARGDIGYLSRLLQFKDDPERVKTYREGAIEILKMKKDSTIPEISKELALDLKKSLSHFDEANHERNLSFVRAYERLKSRKPTVLIVGGLHAQDLKKVLEEKKLNCAIYEPLHYQNDEESLRHSLDDLTQAKP